MRSGEDSTTNREQQADLREHLLVTHRVLPGSRIGTSLGTEFGRPVLLAHVDLHEFEIDGPFMASLRESAPPKYLNIKRLQVYGAPEIRAVRASVDRALRDSPTLIYPHATRGDGAHPQHMAPKEGKDQCLMKRNSAHEVQKIHLSTKSTAGNQCTYGNNLPFGRLAWRVSGSLRG